MTRDCSTDVCAVNYGCGLHKRHNARIDKTDDHNGGCARRLNRRRCDRANADADEFALGCSCKELF